MLIDHRSYESIYLNSPGVGMPTHDTINSPPNPDYAEWFARYTQSPLVLERPSKSKAPNKVASYIRIPMRYYISGQLGGTGEGVAVTRKDRT